MKNVLLEFSAETPINLMILKPRSEPQGDVEKATGHSISGQRGHLASENPWSPTKCLPRGCDEENSGFLLGGGSSARARQSFR
jgi:hypothetical protein